MQRERITEDIYVFISDLYAQVTAAVVVTSAGVVVVDTLLYPEETLEIRRFIENRLGKSVKYVINTHFHADHTTGTCFFPGAHVVAHRLCRELLDRRGRESLTRTKSLSSEMQDVDLVLPDIVFDECLTLRVGKKTFELWSSPGHSPDSIVCLVKEDQLLFAADTLMPIPYFVDGNYDDFLASLRKLREQNFDTIVQGHGEVILRGEVAGKIDSDIDYLEQLGNLVDEALVSSHPEKALMAISVESCGKSRILLNGTVVQLHQANVQALARQRRSTMRLPLQNEQ